MRSGSAALALLASAAVALAADPVIEGGEPAKKGVAKPVRKVRRAAPADTRPPTELMAKYGISRAKSDRIYALFAQFQAADKDCQRRIAAIIAAMHRLTTGHCSSAPEIKARVATLLQNADRDKAATYCRLVDLIVADAGPRDVEAASARYVQGEVAAQTEITRTECTLSADAWSQLKRLYDDKGRIMLENALASARYYRTVKDVLSPAEFKLYWTDKLRERSSQ